MGRAVGEGGRFVMRRLATFGLVLVCLLGTSTVARASTTPAWRVQSTPTPSGHYFPNLGGVACPSTTACIAIGWYHLDSGPDSSYGDFAERWNGSTWTLQSLASPTGSKSSVLNGVSCSSTTACTAVGFYATTSGLTAPHIPLAERWNGTKWSVQKIPMPSGSPNSDLSGVECSSATSCTAVGRYVSSSGTTTNTLIERWNGTTWSVESSPDPTGATGSDLLAVACSSATACTAVGDYFPSSGEPRTLAERWNGTTWSVKSSPNPTGSTDTQLEAVACSSGNACTAVGSYFSSSDVTEALVERWNGTDWALQSSPHPAGMSSFLGGVACTSSTVCTAVGVIYSTSGGASEGLAERWNGSSWTKQSTPSTGADELYAVACPLAAVCTAVGDQEKTPQTSPWLTLAERYS